MGWVRLDRFITVVIWVMVAGCLVVLALVIVFGLYLDRLERQGVGFGPPPDLYRQTQWHALRTPQWSPDGQVIVTQMDDAIYAVTASGDDLWQIPRRRWRLAFWKEDPALYSPTLSSAGRVAYLEGTGDDLLNVKTINIDGRDADVVGQVPKLRPSIAWSPNGGRLAFATDSYDPSGARVVIHGPGSAPDAEFILPDGGLRFTYNHQAIEWSSRDDLAILWGDRRAVTVSRVGDTEYAFAEGGGEDMHSERVFSPSWSPDGKYLYYARLLPRQFGMVLEVVRMDVATLGKHIVLTLDPVAERGIGAEEKPRGLEVEPAGDRLLLVTSSYLPVDRWRDEAYVVNVDSSGLRNILWPPRDPDAANSSLLTARDSLHAAWAPDGSRIAVHNSAPNARIVLYTLRPDGSDVQALLCRAADNEPALQCSH